MTPKIRQATSEDLRFVHSSFYSSYWHEHAKKRVPLDVYRREMDKRIDAILDRSEVNVAFFPEVSDEILGYAIIERDTVHWVYVKGVYREQGIASGLVPVGLLFYSHDSNNAGRKFAESVNLQYNPFRSAP